MVRLPNSCAGQLDYSTAVASNDEAEKALVREKMRGYGARLALYLSDIVRNELPLEPITQALGAHDQHLVDQIDAYAAKRFDEAQEKELEGYGQMLDVANTLVGAIQRTVKPQLPVGAPRPEVAEPRTGGDDSGSGGAGGRPGRLGRRHKAARGFRSTDPRLPGHPGPGPDATARRCSSASAGHDRSNPIVFTTLGP